jgi:HK97 family phage major capsid protein
VAYNNVISRSEVQALIPEDVAAGVLEGVVRESAAMSLLPHVPMSSNQQRIPVIAALPVAYFVNGDTGLKQTTEQNWTNKYLNVEEIAAIVPIPEAVLDDTSFDVWGSIKPRLEEAVGRALDAAVFFGVNKPASWPTDIVASALAAGNTVNRTTNAAAAGGILGDFSDAFGKLEADGFEATGVLALTSYKGRFRQARATTGDRLMDVNPAGTEIDGIPITYPMRGQWPTPGAGAAEAVIIDRSEFMLGVRQDFTYKVLDQAVITDAAGLVVYNLPQQDMVALRVVARFAWQVSNVINYDQPVEANRYPAATLLTP